MFKIIMIIKGYFIKKNECFHFLQMLIKIICKLMIINTKTLDISL